MPRRSAKGDDAYLFDMLMAAREVVEFSRGRTFEQYQTDAMLRRAIERSVEIIGEASRKVSRAFKDAHPEVPWKKIVGQRHRIAHEYDLIEDQVIWRVATTHVPELIRQLEPILKQPPLQG